MTTCDQAGIALRVCGRDFGELKVGCVIAAVVAADRAHVVQTPGKRGPYYEALRNVDTKRFVILTGQARMKVLASDGPGS
jgi:hypothetical protein